MKSRMRRAVVPQHKHIQDELRLSQEKFAKAFQASPYGITISTRDQGLIFEANDAYCRIVGYSLEELVGHSAVELGIITAASRTAMLAAVAADGCVHEAENRVFTKGGDTRVVSVSLDPIDVDGIPCFLGIMIDITERRRLEDALRASEEKLSKVFHANPAAIVLSTRDTGVVLDANDAYLQLLQFEREEVIGRSSVDLGIFAASLRAAIHAEFMAGGSIRNREVRITAKNGQAVDVILSVESLEVAGMPCILTTLIDNRERKLAEQALRESEERFRLVAEIAPVILLVSRLSDGAILYTNPYGPQRLGLREEEVLGKDAASFHVYPDIRARVVEEVLVKGQVRDIEVAIAAPGGEPVWGVFSLTKGHYRGEPVLIGTFADITERKLAEQALRDLNCELDQRVADRTAALSAAVAELERANAGKDAFIAAASHELRTPLTGILGMAETLASQTRGPLNEHQARFVRAIQENGDRLLAMVNGVLNYTIAMSTGSPEHLDLCSMAELAASSARQARVKADKKQQMIHVEVQPPGLIIRSDSDAILQILNALLDNAVKFTPPQGSLGVKIYAGDGDGFVRIEVWDTGIGISAEQMPYLFQPFTQIDQRLAREFDGIGLGLALARRKVELLHGTIAVESTPGSGSRFVVTLPNA
jgi:PAS domain S-box-containing protein